MINKDKFVFTFYGLIISYLAVSEFYSGHGVLIQGISVYVLIIGLSFLISSWLIKSVKLSKRIMLFSCWNIILYNVFAYVLLIMNTLEISFGIVVIVGILSLLLVVNINVLKRIRAIVAVG